MRICILTFVPETLDEVRRRLAALFPQEQLELEYVYPSVIFEDTDAWSNEIADEVRTRIEKLPEEIRIIHVPPSAFLDTLFHSDPPALVAVVYRHWGERVAMTAHMLSMRNFPTLLLGSKV